MAGNVTRTSVIVPVGTAISQSMGTITSSGTGLDGTEATFTYLADENNPSRKVSPLGTDSGIALEAGNLATLLGLFQAGTAKAYIRDLVSTDHVTILKTYRTLFADANAGVARTANGDTGNIDVTGLTELGVSVNVTAMSGTAPSLSLQIQHYTPNGNWNYLWSPAAITTVPSYPSTSVGAGLQTNSCFTNTIKVAWQLSGTTPSFTFSIGLWGK